MHVHFACMYTAVWLERHKFLQGTPVICVFSLKEYWAKPKRFPVRQCLCAQNEIHEDAVCQG